VIRISMPLRQALSKLTLPVFMVASFGLMLLGKADALLAERARMAVADALSPLYAALAEPLSVVHRGIEGARHLEPDRRGLRILIRPRNAAERNAVPANLLCHVSKDGKGSDNRKPVLRGDGAGQ
jgi:rod shape-determining protein MreC